MNNLIGKNCLISGCFGEFRKYLLFENKNNLLIKRLFSVSRLPLKWRIPCCAGRSL